MSTFEPFDTVEGVKSYIDRLLEGPFRCREYWYEGKRYKEFLHNDEPIARYKTIRVFGGDFGEQGVTRPLCFRESCQVLAVPVPGGGGISWYPPYIQFNGLRLYLDDLDPFCGVQVELLDPYPDGEQFEWWIPRGHEPRGKPVYLAEEAV